MAGWWVLEHVTGGRTKVFATVTPRSRDVLPTANEAALHGASCSGSSGAEGRGGRILWKGIKLWQHRSGGGKKEGGYKGWSLCLSPQAPGSLALAGRPLCLHPALLTGCEHSRAVARHTELPRFLLSCSSVLYREPEVSEAMTMSCTGVAVVVVLVLVCVSQQQTGAANVLLDKVLRDLQTTTTKTTTTTTTTTKTTRLPPVVPQPRILGGQRVGDRCQAPFNAMVALKIQMSDQTNSRTYCGAVMLTSQWLVTAALCVFPFVTFASTDLAVVIGDKVVSAPDQDEQTIGVANFYIHPRFNSSTGSNDLALIRLQYPATLSNCVQPLRRYTETACYTAISDCVITGWGPWDENNIYSNSLWPNSGDVKVLDEVVTRLTARSVFQRSAPEGALFALPNNNFVKACVFDWGGMTACLKNGEWLLRGVIAQDNCFVESQPIVITNIDRYKSWIDTCIYNSNACQSL